MNPTLDMVVLSRNPGALHPMVRRGIEWQDSVHIRLHRLIGNWRPHDAHRWSVIVCTRNRGKRMGSQPWFMFLDDDVVLRTGSVSRMVHCLRSNATLAAIAADYLGESDRDDGVSQHVGMGATLFRRKDLDRLRFRWEPGKCECQCCCDDLRRQRREIKYCPGAGARASPHACFNVVLITTCMSASRCSIQASANCKLQTALEQTRVKPGEMQIPRFMDRVSTRDPNLPGSRLFERDSKQPNLRRKVQWRAARCQDSSSLTRLPTVPT